MKIPKRDKEKQSKSDKVLEEKRYDKYAHSLRFVNTHTNHKILIPWLEEPYDYYNSLICKTFNFKSKVLELASGVGDRSEIIFNVSNNVILSDISEESLQVLSKRFEIYNPTLKKIDIEDIEFPNETFDGVVCSGGLSYGDNFKVLNEIYRILKPNGTLILVDSLNHNPIYKWNRLIHFLRGDRSWSTLRRMPNMKLLMSYRETFKRVEIKFFGSLTWVMPTISRIIGDQKASSISTRADGLIRVNKSAFKFVMIATK